jgi:hypothetical protein
VAYGLLPGFDENLTDTDREHITPAEPCPTGYSPQSDGDVDGWIVVKFSRFIEAWHALGRMYVDTDLANASEEFFKPLLNQPIDRVWDLIDPGSFCTSAPPPVPGYVDLDTSEKVFNAVNMLMRRRLWAEKCQCRRIQGACLSTAVINWAWEDDYGNGDSGTATSPPGQVGQLGGWTVWTVPGFEFNETLFLGNAPCGIEPTAGSFVAESSQDPTAKFTVKELIEVPLAGNDPSCIGCVKPGPRPPLVPYEVEPFGVGITFGEPSGNCYTLNLTLPPPGDDVQFVESVVPEVRWIGGSPEFIGIPVQIPQNETGSAELLYQLLFQQLAEIKHRLLETRKTSWSALAKMQNVVRTDPFAIDEPPLFHQFQNPIPLGVVLEIVGSSLHNSGVRYFSGPSSGPGDICGTFGWFSWVAGAYSSERHEFWTDKMVLQVPPLPLGAGIKVWLKPGLALRIRESEDRQIDIVF